MPGPIKNITGGVNFNFSLINTKSARKLLNISFVCLDILGVILCDYFYDSVHKNDVVSSKTPLFITISM